MMRIIKRAFLDYAATTPVDKRVLKVMEPFFKEYFGNPSANYQEGILANKALAESRSKVAKIIGVKPHEVIFTGSGTESNNLALFGVPRGVKQDQNVLLKPWQEIQSEILTTEIEHPSIKESCLEIQKQNLASVEYIPVQPTGLIDILKLKKLLKPETILISIIFANNEIGTIQNIREISSEVKKFKNDLGRRFDEPPYVHIDASQAPYYLDVHLDRVGAHLMTLDGAKIYGPKGVGCLIKKSYVPIKNIIFGGGQEFGFRAGTENVPSIVGFTKALELAQQDFRKNHEDATKLQKYFIKKILEKFPQVKINGSLKRRLPNNINICIEGLNAEFAVIQLDEVGVSCSATTACKSSSDDARSYVVDSLYKNTLIESKAVDCGKSSIRFTLGKDTTKREIDFAINCLSGII